MSRPIDNATRHEVLEAAPIPRRVGRRSAKAALIPTKDDGGHAHRWSLRELPLDILKTGLSRRVPVTVSIRVDHHIDKVWVVERGGRALERLVAELPTRRPGLPQISTDRTSIRFEASAPALGVEIPLIPEPGLDLG